MRHVLFSSKTKLRVLWFVRAHWPSEEDARWSERLPFSWRSGLYPGRRAATAPGRDCPQLLYARTKPAPGKAEKRGDRISSVSTCEKPTSEMLAARSCMRLPPA